MIRLALLICAVLLAGCADRVRLNPGADLAVYLGSTQHMAGHPLMVGEPKDCSLLLGYYSLADGSITLNEQLRGMGIARTFAHELAHAYDHQRPKDMWELLARYQSVDFNFGPHKVSP